MRARLGRSCVILIFFFSPSGSHFGATGGAFWGYMESPPGLLPFTVGAWGAFFCVIWLQPARRLEMRKSSHSVAFSLYCTMSGGQLIMLVKRIICDLMISNVSTHWPSFIVHTLYLELVSLQRPTAPVSRRRLRTVDIASRIRMSVPAR